MADAPWQPKFGAPGQGFGQVNGKGYYSKAAYDAAKGAQMYTAAQERDKAARAQAGRSQAPGGASSINSQYGEVYEGARDREQSTFRPGQEKLANDLFEVSQGRNLLSTELLRQGADRNIRQQMAMAASARPGQVGMAMRGAAQNVGNINSGLAGQQTIAGLQEQAQARGLLSGVLQGARGQDMQFDAQRDQTMLGSTGGQAGMYSTNLANETARRGQDIQVQIAKSQEPAWWERALGATIPILGMGAGMANKPAAPRGWEGSQQIGGVLDSGGLQNVQRGGGGYSSPSSSPNPYYRDPYA